MQATSSFGIRSSSLDDFGSDDMMRVAIHGATGRMGLCVARLCHEDRDVQLVGAAASADDPRQGRDVGELAGIGSIGVAVTPDLPSALLGAEVVIDFSVAEAVEPLLRVAQKSEVAVVTGTTNLPEKAVNALDAAARSIPVLWAPNMSLGVQVLAELVAQSIRRLGPDYDAEIVELHHKKKVDAPSGTAKRLFDAVKEVRPGAEALHGRSGHVGARRDGEVGIFGVRGGDVVGDHTVYLMGPGERIELTHRASSRDLFAHGSIRAAKFLVGQSPGRYTIADVLGG
jgi:4-hydroxy-tetrahydrodipicolinate reductase